MKAIEQYGDLTSGAKVNIELNQWQACTVLKVYDYGFGSLDEKELNQLRQIIGKLKDEVWP